MTLPLPGLSVASFVLFVGSGLSATALPIGVGPFDADTLPIPCHQALDQTALSKALGNADVSEVWDSYYSRYAHSCRHEAIWPGARGDTTDTIAGPWHVWELILLQLLAKGPIEKIETLFLTAQGTDTGSDMSVEIDGSGPLSAVIQMAGSGTRRDIAFGGVADDGTKGFFAKSSSVQAPVPTEAMDTPTAVPLPAPAGILLFALMSLGLLRRHS